MRKVGDVPPFSTQDSACLLPGPDKVITGGDVAGGADSGGQPPRHLPKDLELGIEETVPPLRPQFLRDVEVAGPHYILGPRANDRGRTDAE